MSQLPFIYILRNSLTECKGGNRVNLVQEKNYSNSSSTSKTNLYLYSLVFLKKLFKKRREKTPETGNIY